MNNETKKTEQLIRIYKEDVAKENLQALIHQMKKTMFFIPAMLPDTPEVRELKEKVKGNPKEKITLPKGTVPIPAILNNQKGDKFLPIYSSTDQIPKEPKFELMMNLPFRNCCLLAMDERLEAQGIALNPFTDNLLFRREMIEAIQKEEASGVKQVKVSPKQYQVMMRQKAEFHDFPLKVYQEGAEFIQKLSDEGESVVNEIYQKAYEQKNLYLYDESAFDVMALNVRENLLLVRVELPEVKDKAQLCHRIYVTLNTTNNEIHYFTIEQGKKKDERSLGGVNAEGKHIEYGEAPVESAEIQRILDIVEHEKEQTS